MIINPYIFGGYDADAQAFFTAAGITSVTEKNAYNTFILGLKSNSLYTQQLLLPFLGGTASTHKFNAVNPVDSDAAFRATFGGGWTHSSTGALPNGTNAYADTHMVPSVDMSDSAQHLSIYLRTNTAGALSSDLASYTGAGSNIVQLITKFTDGNIYADMYNNSTNRISLANADTRGFYCLSRESTTSFKLYRNGVQIGTVNTSAVAGRSSCTNNFFFSARSAATFFSNREVAFVSAARSALSDSQNLTYYNLVQALETALGRQI